MTEKKTTIDNYNVIEYEKTNIYVIENIIDDNLCDILRNLIETLPLIKTRYENGNNVECYKTILGELLELDDSLYYEFSTSEGEYNLLLNKINNKKSIYTNKLNGILKTEIFKIIRLIDDKIILLESIMKRINDRIRFTFNSGLILRKIFGPTRLHYDGINDNQSREILKYITETMTINMNSVLIRTSTAIFTLNDDYEGGLFQMPDYDFSIKLKKGSVIIFPPFWTHTHQATDMLNNTFRYTLTTWFCEKMT